MQKNTSEFSVLRRLTRRQMLLRTGAAAMGFGLAHWPMKTLANDKTRKVLFFSKSSGYEHSVIARKEGPLSFAEKVLSELGPKHGVSFTFSKDGSLFTKSYLEGFDAFMLYTTGDLTTAGTDKQPPMSAAGYEAFLEAVRNGKGLVGVHSATDTFHTPESAGKKGEAYQNDGDMASPFIKLIGAEFICHDQQQKARMRVADPKFPGMPQQDFELMDEWYSFKNFAPDMRVLLVQETGGMEGKSYRRRPYPATWARMEGRGRVFYTSLGHREDVWTNSIFESILFGGLAWSMGQVDGDVRTNIKQATPGYADLPPR